jgi:large subunit ribosomal protein L21
LSGFVKEGSCIPARESELRYTEGERILEKHAVFETGGKQYRVAQGDTIFVEKLPADEGDTVTFDKVSAILGDENKIGAPLIEGASVTAKVIKNGKSRKITVYKMNPKKGYRKKQGHRQPYTKIQIESISA